MARDIFLIRHGRPVLPGDGHCCIGRGTDAPLSPEGEKQARALAGCFGGIKKIYASPLVRSTETAQIIGGGCEIAVNDGLNEIDVGEWEGLSFREIRARFSETYEKRGIDWSIPPVGGETLDDAADRIQGALLDMIRSTEGDIVAVTHEGAMRALIWRLMRLDTLHDMMVHQPYGSITVLRYEYGAMYVTAIGKLPGDAPGDEEIEELLDICGTSNKVRAHAAAVCENAMALREEIENGETTIPHDILRAAALLHDMCKAEGRGHEKLAAKILRERGYMRTADMVERHTDGCFLGDDLDGARLLYYADKTTEGTKQVSVERRFSDSEARCTNAEALKSHDDRLNKALEIRKMIDERRITI